MPVKTHGMSETPEYYVWKGMVRRCTDKNHDAYKYYGGRGIRVCKRWLEFTAFYEDMGPRPSPRHQIDREHNSGNYEPGNCRWAERLTNVRNKRSNRLLAVGGLSLCISEWAERLGVNAATLRQRLHQGWTDDAVVLTPVRARNEV